MKKKSEKMWSDLTKNWATDVARRFAAAAAATATSDSF